MTATLLLVFFFFFGFFDEISIFRGRDGRDALYVPHRMEEGVMEFSR